MEIYKEKLPHLGNRISVMGSMAKNHGCIISYDNERPVGLHPENNFNLHTEESVTVAHKVAASLMKMLHADQTVEYQHKEFKYLLGRLEIPNVD